MCILSYIYGSNSLELGEDIELFYVVQDFCLVTVAGPMFVMLGIWTWGIHTHRDCHGSAKTRYYLWLLIPVILRSDLWIYMEIRGYLWSVCYIWTTLMGAAAAKHQCAAALCKLVELINFTPSLNENTLQWIWTRIYWNTIISSTFPWNIGLIFIPLYMHS